MAVKGFVRSGEYYDSVSLMLVARAVGKLDGVKEASVVMGTAENKSILAASGLMLPDFAKAVDTDLLIAVMAADDKRAAAVVDEAIVLLKESKNKKSDAGEYLPRSIEGACKQLPGANTVIISVAGRYAAAEAMKALKLGKHVMLFSDNVAVPQEVELKQFAQAKGLLVMGPDCGTAIINGAPLCFANVVKRGDIGIVAASGTGAQEISAIIGNEGGGISQCIGTGGRDVKQDVGGIMFLEGMKALAADEGTKVIVLVSKPPHESVQAKIAAAIRQIKKPVVAILIGGDPKVMSDAGAHAARDLEQAALLAVALSKGKKPESIQKKLALRAKEIQKLAKAQAKKLNKKQKYLRGLFSGGTLCDETQLLFRDTIGYTYGNGPLKPEYKIKDVWQSYKHSVIDLGEDEFTVGRPHPMIDFLLRCKRIVQEAKDPETAVILLDVVLGYGSHLAPGEELAPAIKEALAVAKKAKRHLPIICSITGTDKDPQNKKKVAKQLEKAGAIVMPTNAAASGLVVEIVKILEGK